MESEEYFRRLYEQNGGYNTVSSARNHSIPYGERSSMFGPAVDNPVNSAAVPVARIITQPIEQHQPLHQQLNNLDNHHHIQVHVQEEQQFHVHQHKQPSQLHEYQQQQQQLNDQPSEQQMLYKCNECGSSWGNLKTFRQHQRKHFNSSGEVHPPSQLNTAEKEQTISALQVFSSTNSDYIPNHFLSLMPAIPQRHDPELPNIYPLEPPKTCNLVSPEMYKPQSHIMFNSQHTNKYDDQ
ncbi:unnamed protein product, partial [Meganyctiphanes norvegica]